MCVFHPDSLSNIHSLFFLSFLFSSHFSQVCPTQTDIFREKRARRIDRESANGWEGIRTQLFKKHNYKRLSHGEVNCSVCCHLHWISSESGFLANTHTHTHTQTHTNTYTLTHTYASTLTHTYTNTYTLTHTYISHTHFVGILESETHPRMIRNVIFCNVKKTKGRFFPLPFLLSWFFALKKKSFLIDGAFQNRRRKWRRKMDGHM